MEKIILGLKALFDAQKGITDSLLCDLVRVNAGDPIVIPNTDTPMIIVDGGLSEFENNSQYDRASRTIIIKYVQNIKNFLEAEKPEIVSVKQNARRVMEGTDTDGSFLETSIKGIINSNQIITYEDENVSGLVRVTGITYDITERVEVAFFEAIMTLEVQSTHNRNSC